MTWCLVSALAVNAEEAALGKLGQEEVSWRRGAYPVGVVGMLMSTCPVRTVRASVRV